jgi:hypothetical protein
MQFSPVGFPRYAGACCFLIIILGCLPGCGSFTIPTKRKSPELVRDFRETTADDYADHLNSLKRPFLATPGVKVSVLADPSKRYLMTLLSEIIQKNEIFFRRLKTASITIIEHEAPLHFSLPRGEIFLSTGLVAKYIKHEAMLVSVLAYELVRSEKLLYPRETIVPVGYLPLERMLVLNRLSLEEKMEVHKWAYYMTVRGGFDGEYYLSWLQTQNRNTADFVLQVGDPTQITREESLFKAFIIKNPVDDNAQIKKSSSKQFYAFLNKVRDGNP